LVEWRKASAKRASRQRALVPTGQRLIRKPTTDGTYRYVKSLGLYKLI